jgi:hypothetical protein
VAGPPRQRRDPAIHLAKMRDPRVKPAGDQAT